LKSRNVYLTLAEEIPKTMRDLRANPIKQLTELKTLVQSLESEDGKKDVPYAKDAKERFNAYKSRIGTSGVINLSSGDPVLDSLFYGYQLTDLITIAGRAGLGKTWFVCLLTTLLEKSLPRSAGPILFLSMEMGEKEIKDRIDCIRFKLPYTLFSEGKLGRVEMHRYRTGLEHLERDGSPLILLDDVYTLDELRGRILLYKPSIVFVDGSYLLEPTMEAGDWKKILYITQNLKRIAKQTRTPIVNTTQMRRGTGTKKAKTSFDAQDELAFGMGYVQDSDIAMTAYQTAQMQYRRDIGFNFAKGRRMKAGQGLIWHSDHSKMEYSFTATSDDDDNDNNTKFEEDPVAVF
jgi:replicative DNA helicase